MLFLVRRREDVLLMESTERQLVLIEPPARDQLESGAGQKLLHIAWVWRVAVRVDQFIPAVESRFADIIDYPEIARLLAVHGRFVIGDEIQMPEVAFEQLELGFGPLPVS